MKDEVRKALRAGAAGFASSFSPNHSGWGGRPMPSTIATDEELKELVRELKVLNRGIFVMATGPRGTPEFMESIAAETGRPTFMVTVLTMYSKANPERALQYYERCAGALARGHEVYIHSSCQPLSFDFTLREPYILYSHDAFDRVKAAAPEERAAIYRQKSFRDRLRENFRKPEIGDSVLRRLVSGGEGRRARDRSSRRTRSTMSSTCRSTRSWWRSCSRTTTRAWRRCSSTRPGWWRFPMPART